MHECGTGVAFGLEAVPSLGFFPLFFAPFAFVFLLVIFAGLGPADWDLEDLSEGVPSRLPGSRVSHVPR